MTKTTVGSVGGLLMVVLEGGALQMMIKIAQVVLYSLSLCQVRRGGLHPAVPMKPCWLRLAAR